MSQSKKIWTFVTVDRSNEIDTIKLFDNKDKVYKYLFKYIIKNTSYIADYTRFFSHVLDNNCKICVKKLSKYLDDCHEDEFYLSSLETYVKNKEILMQYILDIEVEDMDRDFRIFKERFISNFPYEKFPYTYDELERIMNDALDMDEFSDWSITEEEVN